MTEQFGDAPIFDADQHMYETGDALTKFLPEKYSRAVQYAQIGRQTRVVINNRVHRLHPQPDLRARRGTRGAREVLRRGEQRRPDLREMQGKAIDAPEATRNPEDRVKELDRQGVVEALNYPTLGSLVEHSSADDPAADAGDRSRPQPVDPRTLELRLRRPRVLHTDHQSVRSRCGATGAGVDPRARRQGGIDQTWPRQRPARLALPALPEFDPFWRDVEAACLPIVLHASYPRSTTTSTSGNRPTPRTSWRRAHSAGWYWATARSPTC